MAERVVSALRHRDDRRAERARPIGRERFGQRAEDVERALRLCAPCVAADLHAAGQGVRKVLRALARGPIGEVDDPQELADRPPVHLGILARIERREMKAEDIDSSQHARDEREACARAAMPGEARLDQAQVVA